MPAAARVRCSHCVHHEAQLPTTCPAARLPVLDDPVLQAQIVAWSTKVAAIEGIVKERGVEFRRVRIAALRREMQVIADSLPASVAEQLEAWLRWQRVARVAQREARLRAAKDAGPAALATGIEGKTRPALAEVGKVLTQADGQLRAVGPNVATIPRLLHVAQIHNAERSKPAAEPTEGKGKGKAAKAKPAPQPGRWLDRDCNAALNMQRIGESRWQPLELCYWPDQGALPAKGKEYPGLGYKRLRDQPPKAQQQQQPPVAQ
ncbi:hypothetical protein QJQ45_000795 [Haematococcus lacustris]|nr:hypothetical protein QJQ45_000795 [Haematococcus lacustris]